MGRKIKNNYFDAYKYANEFEELSLDIVRIVCEERYNETNIVHQGVTQQTRDKGVDAYLVLKVYGKTSTYTIEAKLRTCDTLSLKDFATSILYYLINASTRHFVVTNISYSKEVIKYIERLNQNKNKLIELIDGKLLQELINKHILALCEYSPELIEYITTKTFSNATSIMIPQSVKIKNIVHLPSYEAEITKVLTKINTGVHNFLVTGCSGSGKKTWIELTTEKLKGRFSIYQIDIAQVQTPRLFVVEILRLLLGIDIDSLFSELNQKGEFYSSIFSELQNIPNNSETVINAIETLIKSQSLKQEEYVYILKIFVEYLYDSFFAYLKAIFIIENLHEATSEMINFVVDIMSNICRKNIIVFWGILLPKTSTQLRFITLEQWYGYVHLLEAKGGYTPSYRVSLGNLTEAEVQIAIEAMLPDLILTSDYFNTFINYYGLLPKNVFEALSWIKHEKAYSVIALKRLVDNNTVCVEYQLYHLMNSCINNMFYQQAFAFAVLIDGNMKSPILEYLSQCFNNSAKELLLKTNFFYIKNTKLFLQTQYIKGVDKTVELFVKVTCAKWLLAHIEELELNYIEQRYYRIFWQSLISVKTTIMEMDDAILYLYHQQAFKYMINLSEIRYQYYKEQGTDLVYYKYFVMHISYLQKNSYHNNDDCIMKLNTAEMLKDELALQYSIHPQYINTCLELALIQYRIAKENYNYVACEQYIKYILSFEANVENREIFPIARIYYALIKKEQGQRKEFILELIKTLHQYPDNKEVKASYYINLAAMYKFKSRNGIKIATKLLKAAKEATFNFQKGYGNLEVEINLLHMLCYQKKLEFAQLKAVRLLSERTNSSIALAKTFNLEAYYYLINGKKISLAIECLKTAVFHSLSGGQGKQSFLFGLNLVHVLANCNIECYDEFYTIFQWFIRHQDKILLRLIQNPYYKNDHMYAALISLICVSKKLDLNATIKDTLIYKYFSEVENINTIQQLIDMVPPYYRYKNSIFILF